MDHILSLSYGKDSLGCLGTIEKLGWPLDRIVTADVWATDTIPADLPLMVEFKAKADEIIKERWGIEVEHIRSKNTYENVFYRIRLETTNTAPGKIRGWPRTLGAWCNSAVKMPPLKSLEKCGNIVYIGIAADEPTDIVIPKCGCHEAGTWFMKGGKERPKNRAKTFPGLAKAMAQQWGGICNG